MPGVDHPPELARLFGAPPTERSGRLEVQSSLALTSWSMWVCLKIELNVGTPKMGGFLLVSKPSPKQGTLKQTLMCADADTVGSAGNTGRATRGI